MKPLQTLVEASDILYFKGGSAFVELVFQVLRAVFIPSFFASVRTTEQHTNAYYKQHSQETQNSDNFNSSHYD